MEIFSWGQEAELWGPLASQSREAKAMREAGRPESCW